MRNSFAKAMEMSQMVHSEVERSLEMILNDPAKRKMTKENNVTQYHLRIDALPMSTEHQPFVENADRTIFVDNVPVEMSLAELEELYGRFGAIKSAKIYNARPELHPGRKITNKEKRELVKKARLARRVMHNSKKWTRARTPVYAEIVFETDEGYEIASSESLRAFGVIWQQHDLRSYSALQTMKNLYIEGFPVGISAGDLEFSLAQRLRGGDDENNHGGLSLWLDAYSQRMAEKRPTTVQVAFPTYHYAATSFDAVEQVVKDLCEPKIRNLAHIKSEEEIDTMLSRVGVQWFLTPKDAEKYWRRQIGMDF